MGAIIDILAITAGYAPYYKAVIPSDAVVVSNNATPGFFANTYGKYRFTRGDSFNIISVGLILQNPFSLCRVKSVIDGSQNPFPKIALDVIGTVSGNHYPIPLLGGDSWVSFPSENTDNILNVFVNVLSFGIDEPFEITGKLNDCYVAMRTVPAGLNGSTFSAIPYIKIQHNLPLY